MIIIPARLQSTRFPRKMLVDVLGYPMVVRSALVAQKVDNVVVATDSEEICSVCEQYGIASIMTDPYHLSGTDRCAEASRKLGLSDDEIVINMQGDEPFLEVEILQALYDKMQDSQIFMATCIKPISLDEVNDSNLVKVVLDSKQCAMYFSRFPIPFNRENAQELVYWGHLGIYAFRNHTLQEFCAMPKSPLEEIEKLEQLRALWNQKRIQCVVVQSQSMGIDTPKDWQKAIEIFTKENR